MAKANRSMIHGGLLAIACAALFMPSGHAQQAARPSLTRIRRASMALHRAGRQPVLGGRRHPGRLFHLLRGRRVGRHLQDHRRRRALAARSSTASRCSRSARSPWRRPIPNVVWAGTGEGKIRSHISHGPGHLQVHRRRQDVDAAWASSRPGRIPRMVIHPRNPDVVLACALGHAYGPQQERGVFRTTDGGKTWTSTCSSWTRTPGCSDIAMDPTNPRILFAGMWQLEIHTWGRTSGGPGGGLVRVARRRRHVDDASTGSGLPAKPVGKVAVAIAPLEPQPRLRAHRDRRRHPLERQGDRGGPGLALARTAASTWRVVSYDRLAMGRAALLLAHGRRAPTTRTRRTS
ncbi:MAG: hypothetical protein M0C28_23285 [Candidatus Moduliflexus flocculans]|nr:hypothetical protein [Candidatus Moduliflexus flocculans]